MTPGVNKVQLKKIVVKYLNENPEDLHMTASSSVSNALYDAFEPSFKDDGTRYCSE
ncbi:MAG: Rap1a/Tai family immunity protein [Pseudomonadales bacterium]